MSHTLVYHVVQYCCLETFPAVVVLDSQQTVSLQHSVLLSIVVGSDMHIRIRAINFNSFSLRQIFVVNAVYV